MNTTIYSHSTIIGQVNLNVSDESMGVLSGIFEPNKNYEKIRSVIWEVNNTGKKAKTYDLLNNLRLNAQLENEYFLFPIGGITILDVKELSNEPIQIDVIGVLRYTIKNYFIKSLTEPILQKPWKFIEIEQKIAFEDELNKELGRNKKTPYWNFFKTIKDEHKLVESEFSAVATTEMDDDVLFAINCREIESDFAIVHLTWKNKKELNPNYPRTEFYLNFDEFKYKRMFPDKTEWEE